MDPNLFAVDTRRVLDIVLLIALLAIFGIALAAAPSARADVLELHSAARMHEEPRSDAATRLELTAGQRLELLDDGKQVSGYYHVEAPDGRDGWVYRTLVRRIAEPESAAISHDPLDTEDSPLFMGAPVPMRAELAALVLENEGYTVGYSEVRRNPLWAAFRLFPVDAPEPHPRPSHFRIDARTTARVKHECYLHQDFDRGHMAPNHALDSRFGRDGQRATFQMSNVAPQRCGLNREPWEALEKLTDNVFAQSVSDLWVVTGPIFPAAPETIECEVQVPEAFFKVLVENETSDRPRMLPVVMVQDDTGLAHPLRDFVTSVDCIEQLTGLDLFPELPDDVEAAVEAAPPDDDWKLDRVLTPSQSCPGGTEADIQRGNEQRRALLAACARP